MATLDSSVTVQRWSPVVVFVVAAAVYLASPVIVQSDSIWSIPAAASVWLRGDSNLDEYAPSFAAHPHGVRQSGEHFYNYFPLSTSLVAVPFVAGIELGASAVVAVLPEHTRLARTSRTWLERFRATGEIDPRYFNTTERFVASLVTALCVVVVFLVARRRSLATGLIVAALFAFGTTAYSSASRVLWQHAPSMLTGALVVFLLSTKAPSRQRAALLGLFAALAYVFRPTNVLLALGVTLLIALRERRFILHYGAGVLAVALPFCAYNVSAWGALLPPYFLGSRLDPAGAAFFTALAGNLVSPARGLFVFSPVLLVAVIEIFRRLRRRELLDYELMFAGVICAHWIVISSFPHWWAGHSIGPRFFTDVLPLFAYFLIRPVAELFAAANTRRAVFIALALVSVAIHTRGATARAVHRWNDGPPNVDDAPERIWDWRDLQFLRSG